MEASTMFTEELKSSTTNLMDNLSMKLESQMSKILYSNEQLTTKFTKESQDNRMLILDR